MSPVFSVVDWVAIVETIGAVWLCWGVKAKQVRLKLFQRQLQKMKLLFKDLWKRVLTLEYSLSSTKMTDEKFKHHLPPEMIQDCTETSPTFIRTTQNNLTTDFLHVR